MSTFKYFIVILPVLVGIVVDIFIDDFFIYPSFPLNIKHAHWLVNLKTSIWAPFGKLPIIVEDEEALLYIYIWYLRFDFVQGSCISHILMLLFIYLIIINHYIFYVYYIKLTLFYNI